MLPSSQTPSTLHFAEPVLLTHLSVSSPIRLPSIVLSKRENGTGSDTIARKQTVRLVLMSDTHCKHDRLSLPILDRKDDSSCVNVLVHAGDMSHHGTEAELDDFSSWLGSISPQFEHILVTHGNHETLSRMDVQYVRERWYSCAPNVRYLQDEVFELPCGLRLYFAPWVPNMWSTLQKTKPPEVLQKWTNFDDQYYFLDDESLRDKWRQIPSDVHVLVTHTPPLNVLDKNELGMNRGCKALYDRLHDLNDLKLHVFGHIHQAFGHQRAAKAGADGGDGDEVLFVNASIEDSKGCNRQPFVVDFIVYN